jgi:hypothetical protein
MNMNATNPAYKREFSTKQDNSAEYYWLNHVRPDLVARMSSQLETTEQGEPKLPPVLKFRGQQLGRVMSRAKQMAQRVAEIEKYIKARSCELKAGYGKVLPLALVMSDAEFARWSYCQEASRRADETADRLIKSLREEIDRMQSAGSQDLVGQMARFHDAEPVEEAGEPEASGSE